MCRDYKTRLLVGKKMREGSNWMRPKGAPQVQHEAELVRLEEDFELVRTYGLT